MHATNDKPSKRFMVGWVLLLIVAGLMTLTHAMLIVVLNEAILFIGYTAFNLYALVVLALPFRRRERWAWFVSWILPLGLLLPALLNGDLLLFYAPMAVACMLGLLVSTPEFFGVERKVVQVAR